MRKQLLLVILIVLGLRIPFVNQAIQGDDVNYLYGASHAQIDPLHPTHARYVLMGKLVDMRGHPHPPLNSWVLGALVAVFQGVREIPFHAAYILFSWIAAVSALAIARQFTSQPLAATVLFLVTPAFVVNGTSFESDVPFVAFWLASIALYIKAVDRESVALLFCAALAITLAALAAYQAIVLVPILLLYGRKWKLAWIAAMTPLAVTGLWQLYERSTAGELPASVLAGYMQSYGLQAFAQKLKNAAALTGHLGWVLFPVLSAAAFWKIGRVGRIVWLLLTAGFAFVDPNPLFWASASVGVLALVWCRENYRDFLSAWVLIFFGAALIIFFAGAARYLLPLVLPIAILASRRLNRQWLYGAAFLELLLSLGLAAVNYQHWDGYRQFARSLNPQVETRRTWVNGEWGLRYYFESEGALPLMLNQALHPGEIVVSSTLAYPIPFTTGGGVLAPIAQRSITSPIPLRLVSLHGHSGYSAASFGLRPFDIATGVIDQVRAESVREAKPEREDLPMNAPDAARQIVSGIYDLENGKSRWMGGTGVVLLKSPAQPEPLSISFFIPPQATARQVRVLIDGQLAAQQSFAGGGAYTLKTPPMRPSGPSAMITITADKTFSVPGDQRELGIVLIEAGFTIH
ncbi:MAG: ArnT family glycosyltransferase [Bryobacteraceae bacterium]